jgi:hypothetical protein
MARDYGSGGRSASFLVLVFGFQSFAGLSEGRRASTSSKGTAGRGPSSSPSLSRAARSRCSVSLRLLRGPHFILGELGGDPDVAEVVREHGREVNAGRRRSVPTLALVGAADGDPLLIVLMAEQLVEVGAVGLADAATADSGPHDRRRALAPDRRPARLGAAAPSADGPERRPGRSPRKGRALARRRAAPRRPPGRAHRRRLAACRPDTAYTLGLTCPNPAGTADHPSRPPTCRRTPRTSDAPGAGSDTPDAVAERPHLGRGQARPRNLLPRDRDPAGS